MSKFQTAGQTTNQAKNDKDIAVRELPQGSDADFDDSESQASQDNENWLSKARDAFRVSDDYFDASIRKDVERDLAHFDNRHAPGSKYYSDAYKFRAKGFRPKTRSVIRRNEAKGAIALFSTSDAVSINAENSSVPEQVVSAEINQEMLNYRLDNTIPWFQIAMGAYQDTLKSKVVISHQFWDFEEIETEELLYDEFGQTVIDNETGQEAVGIRREIVRDTPKIELRPIENIRFSPSADWEDPINSSPYLIDMIPMEIGEIKARARPNSKSKVPWYDLSDENLRSGGTTESYDPIRSQRNNGRQRKTDEQLNPLHGKYRALLRLVDDQVHLVPKTGISAWVILE